MIIRKGHIYALQCPVTLEIKYVGGTIVPKERYDCHINSPKHYNRPLQQWIAKLQSENKNPVMIILFTCERAEISKYEHKFYELYKSLGCTLFNEKGYREQHDCIDTDKLKAVLQNKGIKIKVVADYLGCNSSVVSTYLKDKSTINIEKAKKMNDYILSL